MIAERKRPSWYSLRDNEYYVMEPPVTQSGRNHLGRGKQPIKSEQVRGRPNITCLIIR